MRAHDVSAWFGDHRVLNDITFPVHDKQVTAIIGPSGCGKSTLIRCFNRMHEMVPTARFDGAIYLDEENIYAPEVNPVQVRRRVGMVFQKPNPFPTMSIKENVLAGFSLQGITPENPDTIVERALTDTALWDEVKDKLNDPGTSLSGGQQQRLCIARALAMEPEVLLMDEPCSALDPIATARIEELIESLHKKYTVVIVTHNMQQAVRVSQYTAFLYLGELVEFSTTEQLFSNPKQQKTDDYINGRFG